jgi:hypothetical protein
MSYPSSICADCGEKHGRRTVGVATWTVTTCDMCGCNVPCTEPRDFGHLRTGWQASCKHPRYQSNGGKCICQTCGLDITALAMERDGLTVALLSDAERDDSGKGETHA